MMYIFSLNINCLCSRIAPIGCIYYSLWYIMHICQYITNISTKWEKIFLCNYNQKKVA